MHQGQPHAVHFLSGGAANEAEVPGLVAVARDGSLLLRFGVTENIAVLPGML